MPFDEPGYLARYEAPPDSPYVAKLVKARWLLEKGWIQSAFARGPDECGEFNEDNYAEYDSGTNPVATHFCMLGALQRVWQVEEMIEADSPVRPDTLLIGCINNAHDPINNPLYKEDGGHVWDDITSWNDDIGREVDQVLAVFDAAIAFAREKGL